MPKYIMVYKNTMPSTLSKQPKEQVVKMMEAWGEWLGTMGSAVVDKGNAFNSNGKSITADGVKDADNLLNGYSIIEASDYDEALGLAQNNPMVMGRGGSIELYEAFAA